MTEQEAKTKRCCVTGAGEWRHNIAGPMKSDGAHYCIGSACMAWRLHAGVGPTGVPNVATTDGYCGLAGKA